MNNKQLSQAELQHIEHCNKVLEEHDALVKSVVNETEALLNNYVPILSAYVQSIAAIRVTFAEEVKHMLQSTRELKLTTGSTQEIHNFVSAVMKLDQALTPELIEKIHRLVK